MLGGPVGEVDGRLDRPTGEVYPAAAIDYAPRAGDQLIEVVYRELHRLARGYLQRERPSHSLAPTGLVHEAYLRLIDQHAVQWQSRAHFFAIAAHVMRRVLVDHARAHAAAKRGGGAVVPLQDVDAATDAPGVDLLALDSALDKLGTLDPRQKRIVYS